MGKTPPGGARRTARQLFKKFDGPVDEHFKQSLAGLTSRLGERAARQSANDPQAAAKARRAALEAYDLARARRLKTTLKTAGAAIAAAGVAGFIVFIAVTPDPPSRRATASTERASRIEVAAVPPVPARLPPAARVPSPPAPPPVVPASTQVGPEPISEKAPVESALAALVPALATLARDQIREVQTRLHSFGFNPGPLDGAPGPMTRAAVLRYQQDRGQMQTGTVDMELLAQLRQDPAPQVVAPQIAQRVSRPARASSAARRSHPFEPLRVAAQDFERWLQSLGR
jgi:hypothetical protein